MGSRGEWNEQGKGCGEMGGAERQGEGCGVGARWRLGERKRERDVSIVMHR